ncbi:MAG: uroporphyrinogen decarboxylase family protein [Spirochaetales bacterium]
MLPKEIVRRAVHFDYPPRVPLLYFNEHLERSDVRFTQYKEVRKNEWGYEWEKIDNTMGQPKHSPLTSWDLWPDFPIPDPDAPGRFDHVPAFIAENADKYLMGGVGDVTGFNVVTFIRGFTESMEDLYLEPDSLEALIDAVLGFEAGLIRNYGKFDLDAIRFGDDWGTQNALLINPALWRQVFKPRFQAQFDLVHSLGMDVYWHCCGQIHDILPDLIEIGVDILNLNQPDLFGVEQLGAEFAGQVCFNCPVDHQTVAIGGNPDDIHRYVERLNRSLATPAGGFIGYLEEYSSVGMPAENWQAIQDAFETLAGTNK